MYAHRWDDAEDGGREDRRDLRKQYSGQFRDIEMIIGFLTGLKRKEWFK